MIDLAFLGDYISLITLGICLCVGYAVKQINVIPNKFIPLIMLLLGTLISVITNISNINAGSILGGMFSGLASTGCYELFSNIIGKNTEGK